ncbi:MAG: PDZ domain-containing protein [Leptospiraceae bacterium]|nr:PDZ domain-containing protein [Leptospiraceae bacterium]MCB1322492.1 PDZ domain-containing protein [Leptospiraceae bacterium]
MKARLIACILMGLMALGCRSATEPVAALTEPDGPPYLGVIYVDVIAGVYIVDVLPESPAEAAGLKEGDTILVANGARIMGGFNFKSQIVALKPGDTIDLLVERENGKRDQLRAVLKARPETVLFE